MHRLLLLPVVLSLALCGCMAPAGDHAVSGPYAGGMVGGGPGH